MKQLMIGVAVLLGVIILMVVGVAFRFFGEAADVAHEEFGPRGALGKYEWFKDAAAQLDAKRADLKVYETRISTMEEDYADTKRRDWPRSDREQYNLWQQEMAGLKQSYNSLAADYNAQMAKFNWRFANKGELPKGATDPLPREFKPYAEK